MTGWDGAGMTGWDGAGMTEWDGAGMTEWDGAGMTEWDGADMAGGGWWVLEVEWGRFPLGGGNDGKGGRE